MRSHASRRLAVAALWLVFVLALVEASFRIAGHFAPGRATAWRAGARRHILCVGDSHTYGAGVEPDESYPAQLQRALDAAMPGVFSVINRGVPGFSSTQVRNRLPGLLDELRPDTVLVQVGVNDVWNTSEVAPETWTDVLRAAFFELRLVRFVRVWLHHRSLDAARDWSGKDFGERPRFAAPGEHVVVDWGETSEVVSMERSPQTFAQAVVQATRDYEAMIAVANVARVRIVFLTYPAPWIPAFAQLNRAMADTAARAGVTLVETWPAVNRVPREQRTWTYGAHTGPKGLVEIARDLALVVALPPR